MSAALPIASAGFSLVQGISAAKAAKTQAAEMEYQAKIQRLQGKQTAHTQREQLNTALSTIQAIKATRDVGMSFGETAKRQKTLDNADTNLNTATLSSNLRADSLTRGASANRTAANFSLLSGAFNAGTTVFNKFGGE